MRTQCPIGQDPWVLFDPIPVGLRIDILGSSSKGNCGLLTVDGCHYLVDAGFSGKRLGAYLQRYGLTLSDIDGVFLTHEHQDHTAGLKALVKFPNVRFFANTKTAQAVEARYKVTSCRPFAYPWTTFETGDTLTIGTLLVQTFPVSHDAVDPVGFVFHAENDGCAWATDIGRLTPGVIKALSQVDTLVLEANHDEELLWKHPHRPQYLKERIAGITGHLSNDEVFRLLRNPHPWKCIYLVHLSRECNSVELLRGKFERLASERHFELHIIDPND